MSQQLTRRSCRGSWHPALILNVVAFIEEGFARWQLFDSGGALAREVRRRRHGTVCLVLVPLLGVAQAAAGQEIEYPAATTVDRADPIRARGLTPGSTVTLRAEFSDARDIRWVGRATFRVGPAGEVDTSVDAPLEGSYDGVMVGGLFSRALPADGDESRRFASEGLDAVATTLFLEVDSTDRDSLGVLRYVRPPGIRVEEVGEPHFRGRLFSPESPAGGGVVVVGGSEGGYPDGMAAILAAHGYLALSLPYFGVDGLPAELVEIPLETVVEAVRWLGRESGSGPVALFGTSKGAEAVLLAATRAPGPAAIVAYMPSSVAWSCICGEPERSSWTWGGDPVPAVGPGEHPTFDPASAPLRPTVHYRYRQRMSGGVGQIEIEKFDGPVLLVAGTDDQLWPSGSMAEELMARRGGAAGDPRDELLLYEGAGHLVGKAFLPAGSTRIARGRLETGGSPRANAIAQADAWPRVLAFLEAVLR